MNNKIKYSLLALLAAGVISSCTRMQSIGILNTGNYTDTAGTLKAAANGMNIGFAAYQGDAGYAQYFPIIVQEGNFITPGNEMKYGSIVQNDGTLNFTKADAIYNQATQAGLQVFGHNLMWYQQQNSAYLTSVVGNGIVTIHNIIQNPGFEAATGDPYSYNWNSYTSNGTLTRNVIDDPAQAHTGNNVAVLTLTGQSATINNYDAWFITRENDNFVVGTSYTATAWVRGSDANSKVQLELTNSSYSSIGGYSGDQPVGTSWTQLVWTFTATSTGPANLRFDLGHISNTVYIDDVTLCTTAEYNTALSNASGAGMAAKADSLLQLWIVGTPSAPGIVTHYAGKIPAWDVANEVLADNGSLRTSSNTSVPSGATGYFFWNDYLGKDGIVNAFKYAHQADPNAKLFINDYNLEASQAKTDSIIALVNYIEAQGGKVDGIGTQMHCNLNTSYSGIDYMFQQLAATGLQVRISEMDVTIYPSPTDATVGDPITLGSQAAMYKYIVNSYLKYVPAAQRYGITIWGVDDPDSWRASQLPLLWDKNFAKKPAYAGVLQALKGQ